MKKVLLLLLCCTSMYAQGQIVACKGTTKAGMHCSRKAQVSGYCKQHDPATKHCAGKNKAGQPCGSLPVKGSEYCKMHK